MVTVADYEDVLLYLYMSLWCLLAGEEVLLKEYFSLEFVQYSFVIRHPSCCAFLNNMLSHHTLIIQKEKLGILAADTAFCFLAITMEVQKGKIV